ncbi:RNA exonuclease 3 [Myotisia sp. PD_48]|nr:RNA exonuclease 3 [Myotisia sp. PD_48]
MFESLGLFNDVLCPENGSCTLLNCLFAHSTPETTPSQAPIAPTQLNTASPPAPVETEQPQRKRRRLSDDGEAKLEDTIKAVKVQRKETSQVAPSTPPSTATPRPDPKYIHQLNSSTRRVSPPSISRSIDHKKEPEKSLKHGESKLSKPGAVQIANTELKGQVKKESLNPRLISKPPASHAIRLAILNKLHGSMVRLNDQIQKHGDQGKQSLVLSKDELICMALDEEEKIAKDHPSVYSNLIKLRIVKLSKMNIEDWEATVIEFIRPNRPDITNLGALPPKAPISTGLKPKEEFAVLSTLIASKEDLGKLGYVNEIPAEKDLTLAKRGIEASQGWEKCERCNGRFQVFPGRREDGSLTSSGPCTYHYAKPLRPTKKKTDHIVGQKEAYYPCCHETVGTSIGCTKADNHVFKVSDVKRLAAVLQFEMTPPQPSKGTLPPVCFDCEMGYTTQGLEMIRLTAMSWPEGKLLVDVLVRPIGEVLDLNSRFSGVSPEQFSSAIPYTAQTPGQLKNNGKIGETHEKQLQIVESPAAARLLLFEHLQPETPLLGHALENDLNVCRIIHPTIVDTALLYPHPGGLPIKFSLRVLAKRFLDRTIQMGGGSKGHDSIEDAIATGDLIRVKVAEKWKVLKRSGWTIQDGLLINSNPSAGSSTSAGDGQGTTKTYGVQK